MMTNYHSFHIVDNSPWPLITSMNVMSLLCSTLLFFKKIWEIKIAMISLLLMFLSMYMWWRDISREATFQGSHTWNVLKGLKLGMILFILSEVMFFFSFFWSFFFSSLSPEMEISNNWPPMGVMMFNPFQIPLLNTIILLSSGVSVTWAHYSIMNKNYKTSMFSLILTVILGIIFTYFQYVEYTNSQFSINDSIFGTTFFLTTGFHGLHVIIGTIFLITNIFRMYMTLYNNIHHFNFEAAAWYWHFVDVIWIYLYIFIYWFFF